MPNMGEKGYMDIKVWILSFGVVWADIKITVGTAGGVSDQKEVPLMTALFRPTKAYGYRDHGRRCIRFRG